MAAGKGERFGGDRPKAFANLGGRPLLAESLERLESSDWIEALVVAAPPDWEEPSILLAEELGAGKVHAAVAGGETRSDSVRAGLAEVDEEAAVRPRPRRGPPASPRGRRRARAHARSAKAGTGPCPRFRWRTR